MVVQDLLAKFPDKEGKGKYQSLVTHMVVAGIAAQGVFDKVISAGEKKLLGRLLHLTMPELRKFVGYLVAVHDVGKAEITFQSYDLLTAAQIKEQADLIDVELDRVRHEITSAAYLNYIWRKEKEHRRPAKTFSDIEGAHHQGKTGVGNFTEQPGWLELQMECDYLMRKVFLGRTKVDLPNFKREDQGTIAALLLGIVVWSDWIASSKRFESVDSKVLGISEADGVVRARTKTRIRKMVLSFIKDCGLTHERVEWPDTFCGIWKNFSRSGRRQLQIDVEDIMKKASKKRKKISLMLIEAPPGEGKTEAGLYVAAQMAKQWNKNGFYMAMPTSATATQNIKRMRTMVDLKKIPAYVRLMHSTAAIDAPDQDLTGKDEVAKFLQPNRRGMMSQFGAGTIDQAMLAATIANYSCIRLLGLSNKALIVDEVHSYDAYMDKIIVRLLEWCKALEIPVVLMSATLPPHLKERLLAPYTSQKLSGAYPLITTIDHRGKVEESVISKTSHKLCVRIETAPILADKMQIAKAAVQMVQNGGCICVMMNTVREAQEVYRYIKSIYDGDLRIFHSKFLQMFRHAREEECVKAYGKDKSARPKQSILVATQVIEQAMDLDFDHMLISLAPADLIIQRIGRLHRHEETVRPEHLKEPAVTVMVPGSDPREWSVELCPFMGTVYPRPLLIRAKHVFERRDYIRMPEDIAKVVADGYDKSKCTKKELKAWEEFEEKEAEIASKCADQIIDEPAKEYTPLIRKADVPDDDNGSKILAKTRNSDPSVKIAFLTKDEIETVIDACLNRDEILEQRTNPVFEGKVIVPPKAVLGRQKMAKYVMDRTVDVRLKDIEGYGDNFVPKAVQKMTALDGAWLIGGTKIVEFDGKSFQFPCENIMIIDPEIGCEIIKKKKR